MKFYPYGNKGGGGWGPKTSFSHAINKGGGGSFNTGVSSYSYTEVSTLVKGGGGGRKKKKVDLVLKVAGCKKFRMHNFPIL